MAVVLSTSVKHQIQNSVEQSSSRPDNILKTAPIYAYLADTDGTLLMITEQAAKLLGATSDTEMVSARGTIFDWRKESRANRMFLVRLDENTHTDKFRQKFMTYDGRSILVEEWAKRLPDGKIMGCFHPLEDKDRVEALTNRRFTEFYDNAAIGIYRSSFDGRPVFANPAFIRLMGFSSEKEWLNSDTIMARDWYVNPDRRGDFLNQIEATGQITNFESEIYVRKTGQKIWISESARTIFNHEGDPAYFEGTIEDISLRKHLEADIKNAEKLAQKLSLEDFETGLPNRMAFQGRVAASPEDKFYVGAIRLGRYSHIKSAIGPFLAAKLIQALSRRILENDSDISIARINPDTLGIMWPCQSDNAALRHMRNLVEHCDAPLQLDNTSVDVLLSAGIATRESHYNIKRIDQAIIAAETAEGMNRSVFIFNPKEYGDPAETLSLMSELIRGLDNDDVQLFYQPKLDLKTKRIDSIEALIRWYDPVRGNVSPERLVHVAEETGHILRLTQWTVERAIIDRRKLMSMGIDVEIAVNISTRLLTDSDFVDWVLDQVPAGEKGLCFEITETQMMYDPKYALRVMERFRAHNIKISIDDYGTGYSSLSYLNQIPAHELKIDRSFITNLNKASRDSLLVQSTINLAHNLGMKVTAEGIETLETLQLLEKMGVDKAQGYYISRPVGFDKILKLLQKMSA